MPFLCLAPCEKGMMISALAVSFPLKRPPQNKGPEFRTLSRPGKDFKRSKAEIRLQRWLSASKAAKAQKAKEAMLGGNFGLCRRPVG